MRVSQVNRCCEPVAIVTIHAWRNKRAAAQGKKQKAKGKKQKAKVAEPD
jgi:hypothetical protein